MTNMFWVYVSCALICCSLAPLSSAASADLQDQVRLCRNYSGVATVDHVRADGERNTWKRVGFELRQSSLWLKSYSLYGVEGEGVQEIRYGDFDESWLFYMGSAQTTRSQRFAKTLTDAGEVELSPIPLVRALELLSPSPSPKLTNGGPDSKMTYQIYLEIEASPRLVEFDIENGLIHELRRLGPTGQVVLTVEYKDWEEVGDSGLLAPTQTTSTLWGVGESSDVVQHYRISELKELQPDEKPSKPVVPGGFTIIDQIDGVTTLDGKVIGTIDRSEGGQSKLGVRMEGGSESSKMFVWIGVGLILVASGYFAYSRRGGA